MLTRTFSQAIRRGTFAAAVLAAPAVLVLSTSLSIASTAVTSWDVASEFTDAGNPNWGGGVWSYCEEATLNGPCTLLGTGYSAYSGNVMGWTDSSGSGYPFVAHNVNQTAYVESTSLIMPPHGLQIHPGPNCEYAVVRFTAPAAGTYKVSGQFFGLDSGGATTDVHISVNTVLKYNGNVNVGVPSMLAASFTSQSGILLAANDIVDFQVGCGGNGYSFDSTGLNAVIEVKLKKKR